MELRLQRDVSGKYATLGELYVDGVFQCYTLEDIVREAEGQPVASWKIPGKTAIPVGRYEMILNMSNRFKRVLPLLLKVPGFEGVRIHSGNTAQDTEGCILVGNKVGPGGDSVRSSIAAFAALMDKLLAAQYASKPMFIDIIAPGGMTHGL